MMCGVDDDWNFHVELDLQQIENKCFDEFVRNVDRANNNVMMLLNNFFGHSILDCIGNVKANDNELEILLDKNKSMRHEIETKLDTLKQQQTHYETIKKDQALLNKEIKDTHEAFLMAKKYYKKFLNMYYTIESNAKDGQVIYVQFFTDTKKDTESYSLRLTRHTTSKVYELRSTSPNLGELDELRKCLKITKDLPNILASIRQIFLSIRTQ